MGDNWEIIDGWWQDIFYRLAGIPAAYAHHGRDTIPGWQNAAKFQVAPPPAEEGWYPSLPKRFV
ncbi:hypothetical protein [uncultured Imperialibacter sp.]|uniref:hypothetical protein n=1 Tax=uncultured Imperialibacter sp. TaxID=1672639 RepID=UPI0030DDD660|tara:strand:- start:2520 stop:2711 length:192 start_codon:yes stop_codon:yes gene_type:complete